MQISSIRFNSNKNAVNPKNGDAKNHSFVTAPIGADTVSFGDRISEIRENAAAGRKRRMEARRQAHEEKLEQQMQKHPATAFLYNSEIQTSERAKMAAQIPTLKTYDQFAEEMGVTEDFVKLCARTELVEVDHLETTYEGRLHFIDTEFKKNKEFINYLREKLPSSVSGGQFQVDYNIKDHEMKSYLENREAMPIGLAYETGFGICNVMIDKLDPINQALIAKVKRQRPIPSTEYHCTSLDARCKRTQMVSVCYLSKLGFGDPKTLAQMVISGQLPGTAKKTEKNGKIVCSAKVDISSSSRAESILKGLRKKNPDVIKLQDLAQEMNLRTADIKYFMQNGDLDIIPEYIFWDDYNSVYINKNDPKNSVFIEELQLRKQLEEEVQKEAQALKAEETQAKKQQNGSDTSLRMKIAWYFCPYTRELLKAEAQENKHIGLIIHKEENEEPLSQQEQIILNSYRKRVWETGHAKEAFSTALNQAVATMRQLRTEGIESISDPEIIKIIDNHNIATHDED